MTSNLLNNSLASWFLMNLVFSISTNSTFWCEHQYMLSSSSDTRIFVCSIFCKSDTIGFRCFYIIYSTTFLGLLITSFILLHSLNMLFAETNSSWLIYIYELYQAFEIKITIKFILGFANNTTGSRFCSCWLTYTFQFLQWFTNILSYWRTFNTYINTS